MNKKTFITKPEALAYRDELLKRGDIAIVGELGDKFRVYSETQDEVDRAIEMFAKRHYSIQDARFYLRQTADKAGEEMLEALNLQRWMKDFSVYDDYENMIKAAKMMESFGVLKTAKDVFNFLDNPSKFDKAMQEFIDETLDEYDYDCNYETGGKV